MGPLTPVDRDYESLGQLWDTLREKKARQMAKETPKVKSLEEDTREFDRDGPSRILQQQHYYERPTLPSTSPKSEEVYRQEPKPKLKKRKSMCVIFFPSCPSRR